MLAVFRSLLYLYPAAYRREYGEEMMDVLSEVQAEARDRNGLLRFLWGMHEAAGLLSGAMGEHLKSVASFGYGESFSPMFLSRRFAMRSEFRFPKSTVVLMTLILAMVVYAIEKAKAISASMPHSAVDVGPIREQFTIIPTLLVVLLGTAIVGVLGWAILFALRRSGVHHFSEANASGSQRLSK